MTYQLQEDELVEVMDERDSSAVQDLIVYNDDFNTFDHVINTLIKVCRHEKLQAEQCTYIIHFTGKCAVKKGTFKELRPMKEGILDAGINAEIL